MKHINAPVVTLLVLLLGVGIIQFAAADSGDRGKPKPSRVIRVTEHVRDVRFVDADPSGPSLGDRLIFTSDLVDHVGKQVGRHGAECVTVRVDPTAPPAKQAIVHCVVTADFFGEGQITFQSLAQGTENSFAVTGGTGTFRTARGEAFAKDITPLVEAEVTITLFDTDK
jgi:hypothetical protein